VCTIETSELHVADAATLLGQDPAAPFVSPLCWRGVSTAPTKHFLELKNQLTAGKPSGLIDATSTPEGRKFWLHLPNEWLKLGRDGDKQR
jgi:hypothetical protein